jgi:hypothetical protein
VSAIRFRRLDTPNRFREWQSALHGGAQFGASSSSDRLPIVCGVKKILFAQAKTMCDGVSRVSCSPSPVCARVCARVQRHAEWVACVPATVAKKMFSSNQKTTNRTKQFDEPKNNTSYQQTTKQQQNNKHQNIKTSKHQNIKTSKHQNIKISKHQNIKISKHQNQNQVVARLDAKDYTNATVREELHAAVLAVTTAVGVAHLLFFLYSDTTPDPLQ